MYIDASIDRNLLDLERAARDAARAIPPVWPLASSVAVNPFLGQTGENLAKAGARLGRVAGASITMPRSWYLARIDSGIIKDVDLSDALLSAPAHLRPLDLASLKSAAREPAPIIEPVPTIADLAANVSRIDWSGLIAERFGAWAAGYFDEGQALWAAPRGKGAYAAWRAVSTHDLTPEIVGLSGFAAFVSEAPESARDAIARTALRLGLLPEAMETYFHHMLVTLGGWAQYARYKLWQAELDGSGDETITDFLAIRLIWEEALFERYASEIESPWRALVDLHAKPIAPTADQVVDTILQEAAERATQRALAIRLSASGPHHLKAGRPVLQAAFCIDVRSEVFRRKLEALNPSIQTIGFAGFFGLAASHRRFASDVREYRFPALLKPGVMTCAGGPDNAAADQSARFKARAKRAWKRFKLAAVSSFAFVEATGPLYIEKLLSDALGIAISSRRSEPAPILDPVPDLATRMKMAKAILQTMSLTTDFARLVLITGHGANVVNNAHASGLHCGACGGYPGDVNARLLAGLLNDREVRSALVPSGIEIPADTLFIGALHDTTTDTVILYSDDHPSDSHRSDIRQAKAWLKLAGKATRRERAQRLPKALGGRSLFRRSRDWAEIRPEWGLAGCQAFIVAPRCHTANKNLEGRVFLHDYDWKTDTDFSILELVMTAPVVVASWISLQYYGSTVAPKVFGGGNKLLHNVTGGMGVIEGNGGIMRAGLPWQSVHDGEHYVHEPLRLSVCIEAPRAAMTEILKQHDDVRTLFDNGWLHLFALDEGRMAWRYAGNLQWTQMDEMTALE
jgi:uncharacterized protein YbcC (UPF0753/DUF2309 family)